MRKTLLLTLGVTAVSSFILFHSCTENTAKQNEDTPEIEKLTKTEVLKRGQHLVTIMGCNDCHSPKKMGPQGPEIITELMLSGFPADRPVAKFDSKLTKEGFAILYPDMTAAAGPWGVSFASNLTPDETGIGNWTEEQFKKALTEGKSKGLDGSRLLLPPMPWMNYTTLTDEEIHAIFSYLESITPVKNLVPNPIAPDMM